MYLQIYKIYNESKKQKTVKAPFTEFTSTVEMVLFLQGLDVRVHSWLPFAAIRKPGFQGIEFFRKMRKAD